jgi:molecular chaperone GrpE
MKKHAKPAAPETDSVGAVTPETSGSATELEVQRDRYLRLAADFDNFLKRTARDAEQRALEQKDAFVRDLLPIVDNLGRAVVSDASGPSGQIRRGVEMIWQQLIELLRRHGIEAEESVGTSFDPHRHEAISARRDPTRPDQSVLEVAERGYRRGTEILRPARVIINDLGLAPGGGHGG